MVYRLIPKSRTRQRKGHNWVLVGTSGDAINAYYHWTQVQRYETIIDQNHGYIRSQIGNDGGPYEHEKLLFDRNVGNPDPFGIEGWGYDYIHNLQGRYYAGTFVSSFGVNQTRANTPDPPPEHSPYLSDGYVEGMFLNNALNEAQLVSLGTSAWSRYKPGKPLSQADQAGFETLKDGVPSVPGYHAIRALHYARHLDARALAELGSEYLNTEFGWKPLVSDMKKIYKAVHLLNARLAQLKRDNGQNIRHHGVYLKDKELLSKTSTHGNYLYPVLTTEFYGPAGDPINRTVRTETLERKVNFSARFRYWIPDLGPLRFPPRIKAALFGANLTPSLLYEVWPWSWLIDWFTNLGDVIDNMSTNAAENLTASFAYISNNQKYLITRDTSVLLAGGVATNTFQVGAHVRQRAKAEPYGFGFDMSTLTDRQKLILAALGITRLHW
jgi:hypothetical protein